MWISDELWYLLLLSWLRLGCTVYLYRISAPDRQLWFRCARGVQSVTRCGAFLWCSRCGAWVDGEHEWLADMHGFRNAREYGVYQPVASYMYVSFGACRRHTGRVIKPADAGSQPVGVDARVGTYTSQGHSPGQPLLSGSDGPRPFVSS
jgi:hypothetical protein